MGTVSGWHACGGRCGKGLAVLAAVVCRLVSGCVQSHCLTLLALPICVTLYVRWLSKSHKSRARWATVGSECCGKVVCVSV